MSILAQQLRNLKIKPKWWGSLGMVESVVRYNCMKRGFPVPVLLLPFWEGAGNKAYEISGNMNHGALTNDPKWVAGMKGGNGILFDVLGSYINAGNDASINNIPVIGIESWIYPKSSGQNGLGRIVDKVQKILYVDTVNAPDVITFQHAFSTTTGIWRTYSGSLAPFYNQWLHLFLTYDNRSTANIPYVYFNGILQGSFVLKGPVGTASSDSASSLLIGNRLDGIRTFDGMNDGVRIYNSPPTPAQIKFAANNPYFMFETPEELWGPPPAGNWFLLQARNELQGIRGING